MLGAIFSIIGFEICTTIFPSDELRETQATRQELALIGKKLEPFVELASEKYPKLEVENALDGLLNQIKNIRAITSGIEKWVGDTSNRVSVPELSVAEIQHFEGEQRAIIRLVPSPSNDLRLGEIRLKA